ncbi:RNA polymerase sigma factor [Actinosynnema sp. NPDC091369]
MTATALPAHPWPWPTACAVTWLFLLWCAAPLVTEWLSRHVLLLAVRRGRREWCRSVATDGAGGTWASSGPTRTARSNRGRSGDVEPPEQPRDRPELPEGESRRIADLYLREAGDLFRYGRSLPGTSAEDAKDLVQTAFQELVRAWAEVGGRAPVEHRRWLRRVLKNKAIDDWRKTRAVDTTAPLPEPVVRSADLSDRVGWSIALARCWAAIERMPLMRQRVAFLVWREGWPTAEVADHLSISVSTVRGHLWEARRRLRADLGHLVTFIEDEEGDGTKGGTADGR